MSQQSESYRHALGLGDLGMSGSSPEEDDNINLLERLSVDGSAVISPESSARSSAYRYSGSEGYFADDDEGDLSSTITDDDSDDEQLLHNCRRDSKVSNGGQPATNSHRYSVNSRSPVFREASSLSSTRKFLLGIVIVIVISLSWVTSTQTTQSTYNGSFSAPFFIVWFGTSCMIVVFPATVPLYFITNRVCINKKNIKKMWRHSTKILSPRPFRPLSLLTSTILFSIIWMPTNYLYVRALMVIAATDVTAIFSTAPAFVFILSMIILREPPLLIRFFAVILCVGGIVLFAYVNGFEAASIGGILMSVGSAVGAALYKTLLKWRVKEASLYQMSIFVSSIGAFNMLVMWPVVFLLHFTGAEMVVDIPWLYISCSSIASVVFNFAINFGIAYTFPLFISLGTIMGVPINALFDAFIRHVDLLNWKITAMDLIIGGFLLILVPPSVSRWIEGLFCCFKFRKTENNNESSVVTITEENKHDASILV